MQSLGASDGDSYGRGNMRSLLKRRGSRQAFRRHLMIERLECRRLLATIDLASRVSPLMPTCSTAMNGSALAAKQGDSSLRMQSSDGRYVVFVSTSQNLAPVEKIPSGIQQVFRYDRSSGEVLLVSVASDGVTAGNGKSDSPTISGDGSRVAFRSESTNLSELDGDSYPDIYVRDFRHHSITELVSVNSAGTTKGDGYSSNPRISENGERIVFESNSRNIDPLDTDSTSDIYVRDLEQPATFLVSVDASGTQKGNRTSTDATISADGKRVAFASNSSNLVPLDADEYYDVFVRDLDDTPTTILVSVNSSGTEKCNGDSTSPLICADGGRIVFESTATNIDPLDRDPISDIYVRTLFGDARTQLVNVNADGTYKGNSAGYMYPSKKSISADGTRIAFITLGRLNPLDTDQSWDVYVRDIGESPTTFLASVNSSGKAKGNGSSLFPVISNDGIRVAFLSNSSNLDPKDADSLFDVYVRELDADPRTILVSAQSEAMDKSNGESNSLSISGGGDYVSFGSDGSNLIPDDLNDAPDVILFSLDSLSCELASPASLARPSISSGRGAELDSSMQSTRSISSDRLQRLMSTDGRYTVFVSSSIGLVSGYMIPSGVQQIYRYDRITREVILVSVDESGSVAGNQTSDSPTISADGNLIAFRSLASNLHPLDPDNTPDIFVRDLSGKPTTVIVSTSSGGGANAMGHPRSLLLV